MKNSIKKKFIDILFEPEETEEESYVELSSKTEKPSKKNDNTIKAKDILYRKSEKTTFINLDEGKNPKSTGTAENKPNIYEFSTQISPIFGVLKENRKSEARISQTDEKQINKPDNVHLDIITSPIYGYSSREEAGSIERIAESESVSEYDEEELHRLLDKEDAIREYDDHTYDDLGSADNYEEINLFNSIGDEE
ncbi:MAG: hypothetical protein IJI92_09120 [Erysipelotrichaceae bacterium]|nr:hypothetical protein [Erysipelotrichaceae bacterium]